MGELRKDADEIILNIWNEVEERFSDLPDDLKREKATEYGLTYVYRPMERVKKSEPYFFAKSLFPD